MVMKNVNGVSISNLLSEFPCLNDTDTIFRAIDKTSKWLNYFQRLDYEPIRQNIWRPKRAELMERNVNITLKYQKNNILLTHITERLTDVLQNWPKTVPVLCHKDLTPWNVIINDEDIYVIDYEATCICDPEYDIAWFSTRLVLSNILNSKKLQSTYYFHFVNEFIDKFNKDRFFFWRTIQLLWTYKRVQKERKTLKSKIFQRWKLKTLESELKKSLLDIY